MAAVKTVLVLAQNKDASAEVMTSAATFALEHDAHLVALTIGLQRALAYAGLPDIPPDVYADEIAATRSAVDETMAANASRLTATGVSFEVRGTVVPAGEAGRAFAHHARYADLSIFPRTENPRDWHPIVDATLFESGRPILLCPPGASLEGIGRKVAIAWHPGAEAARAAHDALDIISEATDVHVIAVDPRVGGDGHGEEPGADLATVLSRHGLPVSVDAIPSGAQSVAGAILRQAQLIGADMIVSGAYGHSRLTEILLGGVTRELMDDTPVPLLMAH